jgi:hypothetical protein
MWTKLEIPSEAPSSNASGTLDHHPEVEGNPNLLEKSEALPAGPVDPRPIHGWKWFMACVAIYSTAILYGLDTTIAADVQPAIVETFGGIEKLAWIGSAFPLGSIASILPLGTRMGNSTSSNCISRPSSSLKEEVPCVAAHPPWML